MERLKHMNLKKAFFSITVVSLLAATLLSVLSVLGLSALNRSNGNEISFSVDSSGVIASDVITLDTAQNTQWYSQIIGMLQIVLPILFYVAALLLSSMVFYRTKLKKPLAVLQSGAERIQKQDLDFVIERCADDELGALCTAFETMRLELLKSSRELWRQMDERKRLNAAFSHDLRNPVTVLKGSASMLEKGLEKGALTKANSGETVSLIKQYAGRIESYVEAMTGAQKLDDLKFNPQPSGWIELSNELQSSLSILSADTGIELAISCKGEDREIKADKYIIYNTAENLVSNALRYAAGKVTVAMSCDSEVIKISVSDDGPGFSSAVLSKGAVPFLHGNNTEPGTHFGMGLYICRLLCEKHNGQLILENCNNGAKTTASFFFGTLSVF